ncbi:MAG: GFA family protein [Hyphomicrobiaceae bacterium]
MTTDHKTGGCQCGALRFATQAPLESVYVCHCRMCQKSVGGPFAVFAKLPLIRFRWTVGRPAEWASSSLGFRQFCAACGTPIGYRYRIGEETEHQYLTGGAFDDFQSIVPTVQMGLESKCHWLDDLPRMPVHDLGDNVPGTIFNTLTSYQHPDREVSQWTPRPPGA